MAKLKIAYPYYILEAGARVMYLCLRRVGNQCKLKFYVLKPP